ncbi:hypothetical protein FOA52_010031 [Chlamydomonas sp. UWO 241]|nr:hypothetical protein FOA52_010031 [Chlamydomonas sp. UWO 241]
MRPPPARRPIDVDRAPGLRPHPNGMAVSIAGQTEPSGEGGAPAVAAPAPKRRVASSAVVVASSGGDDEAAPDADGDERERNGDGGGGDAQPGPPSGRGTGEHDDGDGFGSFGGGGAGSKRPAERIAVPEDAGMRKRNRRMFAGLLGTLQQFSKEEQQFQGTSVAQRRVDQQKRAEERAVAERDQIRLAVSAARVEARMADIAKLQEVNIAADIKVLEIMYAKKVAKKESLAHFLTTSTSPHLYWVPAEPSPATDVLFESAKGTMQTWRANTLAQLEAEKEGLLSRAAARQDVAAARQLEAAVRREEAAAHRATGGEGKAGEDGEEGGEEGEVDAQDGGKEEDCAEEEEHEGGELDDEHAGGGGGGGGGVLDGEYEHEEEDVLPEVPGQAGDSVEELLMA